MMRILVDALSIGYGGGQTYVREMLPRLAGYPVELHVLISAKGAAGLRAFLRDGVVIREIPQSASNPFARFAYQRFVLPDLAARQGIDVVFVPGGLTGLRKRGNGRFKLVSMVQNMLLFEREERQRYRLRSYPKMRLRLWLLSIGHLRTLRQSDRVIFISNYSARVVKSRLATVDCRVIHHGGPDLYCGEASDISAVSKKYGLERPYLLYVSILDPYKHQDKVIAGFELYMAQNGQRDLSLVLAGPVVGAYGRQVSRWAENSRYAVRCLGHVPPEDLPALLRQAEVLLFASTCECCPFVLLEYLAAARPIICSDKPPMPEIAGDGAALFVPAMEPAAWAKALAGVLSRPGLARQLAEGAAARSKVLTWEETARRTYRALVEW